MDWREKAYVSGKALENRCRFNENEESILDDINPLNWLGSMAGALGTAPLEARDYDSNLPYVAAILDPLIQGRMGFNPLGSAINTGKKIGSKVAQSMKSGALSNAYKLNPYAFKPNPESLYASLDKNTAEKILDSYNINPIDVRKNWSSSVPESSKYIVEANKDRNLFQKLNNDQNIATYDMPLSHLEGSNVYKKNWLTGYKRIEPTNYISEKTNSFNTYGEMNDYLMNRGINPNSGKVNYQDLLPHSDIGYNASQESLADYKKLFGQEPSIEDTKNIIDRSYKDAWKEYAKGKAELPESWKAHYDRFIGQYPFPGMKIEPKHTFDFNYRNLDSDKLFNLKNDLPKNKKGGVVKDDMGYWNPDNHGKIVEISSPDITMEGVDQPLIGISDEGDQKYMLPGKNYKFKGKKVREYPVAKNGVRQEQKGLQNLDDLLNFTNYNKPQPGGWLNKYN